MTDPLALNPTARELIDTVNELIEEVNTGGTGGDGNILPWDMTPPPAPPVACAYPFNSDDAFAISSGSDGAVDMTGAQSGQLVTQGGVVGSWLSTDALLTTIDFTSGKKVVEVAFSSTAAALASAGGSASVGILLVDPTGHTIRAIAGLSITEQHLS